MSTSEEWTTITRSKGKRQHSKMSICSAYDPLIAPPWGPDNIEDLDLTLEKLVANYQTQFRKWQSSRCRATLINSLDRARRRGDWRLTKAFCIASGSFSRFNQTNNRRALLQLAAFVDIGGALDILQDNEHAILTDTKSAGSSCSSSKSNPRIRFYAQEPAYTSLDKRFLEHIGVQYIHVPRYGTPDSPIPPLLNAEPFIDTSTFLFEPFIERRRTTLRHLYARFPCLYIGTRIPDQLAQVPCSPRDFFRVSDAQLSVEEGLNGWVPEAEQRRILPELRRRNEAAIRFAETRMPGRYFPRFEEEPAVFEGLMAYWGPIEADEGEAEVGEVPGVL
ncbi:SRR1 [Teratosphaeria destructans]|uniref:SRR1 n=1 Tax=Teratosphaeria destructans TaxID=418781 RepID=A0A9W7SYQ8_9PEZI|nr:SRR1 [Teratosphaeria destructans]